MIFPSATVPPGRTPLCNAKPSCRSATAARLKAGRSGVLYDNVRIDGNGLSLANRGSAGAGAGWSAANSVLWQCTRGPHPL